MSSVFRALLVYAFLLVAFRITGKRSLAQLTTFDFLLLLIMGDATQQALLGDDFSFTNAVIVISTLMVAEMVLTKLKARSSRADRILESLPLIIVDRGRPLDDRMQKEQVDLDDVLTAAREQYGLEGLDAIKYAVIERSGGISIVPWQTGQATPSGK